MSLILRVAVPIAASPPCSAGVQAGGEPASSEAVVSFTAGPDSRPGLERSSLDKEPGARQPPAAQF